VIQPADAPCLQGDVEHADILVGIPSYNNARTIGHVVRAVQAGLTKYFGGYRAVILNSDGDSRDGTQDVVRTADPGDHQMLFISHPVFPIHRLTVPYHGIPGKGSAFRCIFRAAERLGARACAVVDADLRSITPEWMQLLVQPVLEDRFDYVAPYYLRHKYDGTITNSIVYPLTRALYGQRVRQPIGGDFGVSGRLAAHYLTKPVWDTDVARYGIDIWMTTTAICDRFRVAQAFLGAKIHDAKDPGADLSDMLVQVLGTVFGLMETYEHVWRGGDGSADVPVFGFSFAVGLEPIAVDRERMIGRFRNGVDNLREIWALAIDGSDLAELEQLASLDSSRFRMNVDLWVRVVYDLACAYHLRVIDRDQLVRSSLPLYIGWVASFVGRVADSTAAEVDQAVEELCAAFESNKDYLRRRWSGTAEPEEAHRATTGAAA
jgi:glycosyltransferase involved in cell wall biosynthesis